MDIKPARHPNIPFQVLPEDYDIEGNCWIWKWSKTPTGHPLAHIDGKLQLITRWLLRDQLTPEKPLALHKPGICHNPSCINIDHLYAGTRKDNMADRELDGTETYIQGEKTWLTTKQVIQIYLRLLKGEKANKLAQEYGVHRSTIGDIKNGKTWREVTQKVNNKLKRMKNEKKLNIPDLE